MLDSLLILEDDECHFLPFDHKGYNLLDFQTIWEDQKKDYELKKLREKQPHKFQYIELVNDLDILVYTNPVEDASMQWCIYLTKFAVKGARKC